MKEDRDLTGARIFLADDHPAVVDGLRLLLEGDRFAVCGQAAGLQEALEKIPGAAADLVIVDLSLGEESGMALLGAAPEHGPPMLVYSMHEDALTIRRALDAGAGGYVTKREPSATLLKAVRQMLHGERSLSPRAEASLQAADVSPEAKAPEQALSERELLVLRLLARGETNADICAALKVSPKTVESYYMRMVSKLGLSGTKMLRKYAHKLHQHDQ